jgi:hypothetical protein
VIKFLDVFVVKEGERKEGRGVQGERGGGGFTSRTRTPAPSPITKPSRSLSNGRDERCGRSL